MNQFVFYKSFYEAILYLPKEVRGEVYEMICQYCFEGKEPESDGMAKAMFTMMKANIDSANKRYLASIENGKKGGAPKGNQNAKKQPKNNLELTQKQPKNNHNINNNINNNKNNNINNNINNNKNNNMIIIYNWEDYKKCECLTKENKICGRRSSYNINGKNYCNQHSKPLIGEKYKKKEYFKNKELNDLFLEYLDMRIKLKCKNTDRAITLLLNELNKYDDETKIEMINNSIMNSWKSVYPIKKENKKRDSEEEVLKYLEEMNK